MSVSNVTILNKEMENLSEDLRERVARYITEHLEDIKDELRWEESFKRSSSKLAEFARQAKKEIRKGEAVEMDYEKL